MASSQGEEPLFGERATQPGASQRGGAAAAEEEVQEDRQPVPAVTLEDLYKSNFDTWFASLNVVVPMDLVRVDVTREHGQIRRTSAAAVEEKMRRFRAKMPKEPLRLTLWPVDLQSMFIFTRGRA